MTWILTGKLPSEKHRLFGRCRIGKKTLKRPVLVRGRGGVEKTYVIRTDDNEFKQVLDDFLFSHCEEQDVNAAVFELNEKGSKEVMEIVFEK